MKKFLKASLVAVAVAGAFGAQAGTINELTTTYSQQGTTSTASITTAAVTFTLGAEYAEDDVLVLSLTSGGLVDSFTAFPASVTAGAAGQSVTLGKLISDATSITYRVTNVDNALNAGTTGLVVAFGVGVKVDGATIGALAAGDSVDLSAVATTGSGVTVNFDTDTEQLALVEDQINDITIASATVFDGEIDVTNMRETFTGGDTVTDTLVIAHVQKDLTGWQNTVTEGNVTVVVNGDFEDLTGQFAAPAATSVTMNTAENMLTLVYPNTFTTDTITFTSAGTGSGVTLAKQSFNVDASQSYLVTGASVTSTEAMGTDVAAGAWTLNGANINIPYMPYADLDLAGSERAIGQTIYVTNHGSQSGGVFVTATSEDGTVVLDNVWVADIAGNELLKIAPLVRTQLLAEGFTDGKLSIDVTVNAADEDISVYAAFKHNVELDRAVIINDQYKGK